LIESHLGRSRKFESVSEYDEGDVTQPNEEDHTDEEDIPRWQVVSVKRKIEAHNEEICDSEEPSAGDSVVREDVTHDRDFRVEGDGGPDELTDEGS